MPKAKAGDFVLWQISHGFTPLTYLGATVDKVEGNSVYVDAKRWGPCFSVRPICVTTVDEGQRLLTRLKQAEERMNHTIKAAKASFEAERDSIIIKNV